MLLAEGKMLAIHEHLPLWQGAGRRGWERDVTNWKTKVSLELADSGPLKDSWGLVSQTYVRVTPTPSGPFDGMGITNLQLPACLVGLQVIIEQLESSSPKGD